LKSIIGPVLIFLGYGVYGAALGQSSPLLLGGLAGVIFVFINLRQVQANTSFDYIRPIINYCLPIFYSSIFGGLFFQALNFILSQYVGAAEIGNYSAAQNFNVLISFILTPISTAMFPLLSKLKPEEDFFKTVYINIIKYEALAAFPVAAAVIALSNNMIGILYGPTFQTTALYVKIAMLNYFFLAFGTTINGIVLNSQKRTDIIFRSTLIYLLVGIPMGIILVPRYGVLGFQATNILAPKLGSFYSVYWLRKYLGIKLELSTTLRVGFSAFLGYFSCIFVLGFFSSFPWLQIVLGGLSLILVYLAAILATGALVEKNIRDMKRLALKNKIGLRLEPVFDYLIQVSRK
jgi:O-antigen/teichoic acid export membrane protein